MTDHIGSLYVENEMKYRVQFNKVWSMMKTRHDSDVIDHTNVIYTEIGTQLSWPMG